MEEENKKKFESFDDEWLTRALRARSQAAPRPGLEERILARLATPHESSPQPGWRWMPALAVALGLLLIVLVGWEFLQVGHRSQQDEAKTPQPMKQGSVPGSVAALPKIPIRKAQNNTRKSSQRAFVQKHSRAMLAKADALPKLDRFPAETPASEQERLMVAIQRRQYLASLAQYARDFRQTNDLIIEKNSIPPLSPETADENPNR